MKKIGLLTFHGARNYGSVLQAYALQQIFIKFGYSCEIIDYRPEKQEDMYKLFRKPTSLKNVLIDVVTIADYKFMKRRDMDFLKFINNKLVLSSQKYTEQKEVEALANKYDIFCSGSDQIWNLTAKDYDYIYLLYFTPKRKFSYAPSIGGEDNVKRWTNEVGEKEKDFYEIDNLDLISVREPSAISILKKYTTKQIQVVLDPTLLLDKNAWKNIASKRNIGKKYIFLYTIGYDKKTVQLAKVISRKLNLPIITLYTLRTSYKVFFNGVKRAKYEAPEDFINLMLNAEFVVTNTFHGTAFSINLRKNFFVSAAHDENQNVRTDERIHNILEITGLNDKVIDIDNDNIQDADFVIDYNSVIKRLSPYIEESLEFIKRGLGMHE